MTGGSHIHPDKYLGVAWADRPPPQSGLSARQVLQSYPPKRNLVPRFNEWLKGELEIGVYLDRLVAIPVI